MEVTLRHSFMYLLHGLSLRVQTTEITAQERSQDLTDLGPGGRPAVAHLDSWCQVKNVVAIQAWLQKLYCTKNRQDFIHCIRLSQLAAWPLASSGAAWEGSWQPCHCLSCHRGPTQPIPSPHYIWEVKVRKDKEFNPKRKDLVLFPASSSTKLLHVTIPFKPTPISKVPQNFLPHQAGVNPLEPSSQSLGPHNNQKLPARHNLLPSSHLHPTFLSAFLAPTA